MRRVLLWLGFGQRRVDVVFVEACRASKPLFFLAALDVLLRGLPPTARLLIVAASWARSRRWSATARGPLRRND